MVMLVVDGVSLQAANEPFEGSKMRFHPHTIPAEIIVHFRTSADYYR
jgi:hypothetical protein